MTCAVGNRFENTSAKFSKSALEDTIKIMAEKGDEPSLSANNSAARFSSQPTSAVTTILSKFLLPYALLNTHETPRFLGIKLEFHYSCKTLTKLASFANKTACVRLCTPNFRIIAVTCAFTVVSAIDNSNAICLFNLPSHIN